MDSKEQVVKAMNPLCDALATNWAESSSGNAVMLKAKALKYIASICEEMATELESNDLDALRTQLRQEWKRLKKGEDYTAEFEKLLLRLQPAFALENLKEELARCEEEKKANLESYTMEVRTELKELRRKCLVKVDDQEGIFQAPALVQSSTYSEEVIKSCELQLQKWKGYYDSNEKIILAIRDYETAWLNWKMLVESIEKDSSRLQNRKGILLKQEIDIKIAKKAVNKALVAVQNLNAPFKQKNGKDFTVRGQPVLDYVQDEVALSEMKNHVRTSNKVSYSNKRGHMSSEPTLLKRLQPSFIPSLITTKKTLAVVNTTEKLRRRSAKLRQARLAVSKKSSKNAESVDQSQPAVPGPSSSHKN